MLRISRNRGTPESLQGIRDRRGRGRLFDGLQFLNNLLLLRDYLLQTLYCCNQLVQVRSGSGPNGLGWRVAHLLQ